MKTLIPWRPGLKVGGVPGYGRVLQNGVVLPVLLWATLLNGGNLYSAQSIGHAGMLFEPVGHARGGVQFVALAKGYRVFFEPNRAVFDFGSHRASMTFSGAGPSSITGESPAPGIHNYYRGDNASQWSEGVQSFERIRYRGVRPGIDLIFYGRPDSEMEFDLILSPGANPALVELQYDGFGSLEIGPKGDLLLKTPEGVLRQRPPEVTQADRRIRARYVRRGTAIGIKLGPYDTSQALVIDPRISYATYVGGSDVENTEAIAIDDDGNYYIAANSFSANYPRLPAGQPYAGDQDIVVSKFSASNILLYSTVIGGSSKDVPGRAVVDTDGSLYVSFSTASTNFPRPPGVTIGAGTIGDGVLKLSPTGALTAMALMGPSTAAGPYDLTLDTNHNIWVTGGTTGVPGQTGSIQARVAGGTDILVASLNNLLTQIKYLTYLGTPADESGNRIRVDVSGNVYLSGVGGSAAFPTGAGKAFPGAGTFALKLDTVNNRIVFATYLSAGNGGGYGLVLDGNDLWVAANSSGKDFAPTPDAFQKVFGGGTNDVILVRLSALDGTIGYATYFGGTGSEFANDLVQDPYGNLILYGNTTSPNLPTTTDAMSRTLAPSLITTAYISVLDVSGGLVYSSYAGGSSAGSFTLGLGLAVDKLGNAIGVGATSSTDFPVTGDAFQKQMAGVQDVYIARFEFVAPTDPYLARIAIQNAASFRGGPIAPGEVITIYPRNVGPATLVTAALTADRRIATLIGGTRVLFDDIPAPLVYTVGGQVSLVAPYEVQGKAFTRVVVEYNGVKSRPMLVPVTATAPGVFTAGNGSGPAVVINEDGSFNSVSQPASRGSIIVFFATGEGQTNPSGVNGRLNEFSRLEDFPRPVAAVNVTIGGQAAEVLFGAGAPGFLAGLMQFNVRVPQGVEPGPVVPLTVSVGGVPSAAGVTMAVR